MKRTTITCVLLATLVLGMLLRTSATENPDCRETQYATLGIEGQVHCLLDGAYDDIKWFFGNGTELVAQRNKNVTKGPGYESGDYNVLPAGSLIIRNVTMEKQGYYKVHAFTTVTDDIQVHYVTLIAVDFWRSPVIEVDGCSDNEICIIKAEPPDVIRCFIEIVPPNIILTTYDPSEIVTSENVTSNLYSTSLEVRVKFELKERQTCATDVYLYCNKTEVTVGYSSARRITIRSDQLRCSADGEAVLALGLMLLFFLLVVLLAACQVWVARRTENKHKGRQPTVQYSVLLNE